jgi:hypothetical protein
MAIEDEFEIEIEDKAASQIATVQDALIILKDVGKRLKFLITIFQVYFWLLNSKIFYE